MKKFDIYIYFHVILTSMLLISARSGKVPPLIIYLSLAINLVFILIRIFLEKKYNSDLKKHRANLLKKDSLKK